MRLFLIWCCSIAAICASAAAISEFAAANRTHHAFHTQSAQGHVIQAAIAIMLLAFVWVLSGIVRQAAVSNPLPSPVSSVALHEELRPIQVTGGLVNSREEFYWQRDDVRELSERHHTSYVGGSAGVSVRVARGVTLRSGRNRGRRIDQAAVEVVDIGRLLISKTRLLYIGQRTTHDIPLSKIVEITPYSDGFKISRSNASPIVLVTSSPDDAVVLGRVIRQDLAGASLA